MFTQPAADGIREFVQSGGYALSEARLAWNDDRGYAAGVIPGMGLSEVFGVRERELRMREGGVDMRISDTSHPVTGMLTEGDMLRGSLYAQTFELLNDDSRVLAEWEDAGPVMVASRYGNGETLITGSHNGWAAHPEPSPEFFAWLDGVVQWAGIGRPFTSGHDGIQEYPVEIRMLENPGGRVLFVLNHGHEHQDVEISLRAGGGETTGPETFELRDVIRDERFSARSEDGILNITAGVGPRDVRIFEIRSEL
jgi:beta-galactosidase